MCQRHGESVGMPSEGNHCQFFIACDAIKMKYYPIFKHTTIFSILRASSLSSLNSKFFFLLTHMYTHSSFSSCFTFSVMAIIRNLDESGKVIEP